MSAVTRMLAIFKGIKGFLQRSGGKGFLASARIRSGSSFKGGFASLLGISNAGTDKKKLCEREEELGGIIPGSGFSRKFSKIRSNPCAFGSAGAGGPCRNELSGKKAQAEKSAGEEKALRRGDSLSSLAGRMKDVPPSGKVRDLKSALKESEKSGMSFSKPKGDSGVVSFASMHTGKVETPRSSDQIGFPKRGKLKVSHAFESSGGDKSSAICKEFSQEKVKSGDRIISSSKRSGSSLRNSEVPEKFTVYEVQGKAESTDKFFNSKAEFLNRTAAVDSHSEKVASHRGLKGDKITTFRVLLLQDGFDKPDSVDFRDGKVMLELKGQKDVFKKSDPSSSKDVHGHTGPAAKDSGVEGVVADKGVFSGVSDGPWDGKVVRSKSLNLNVSSKAFPGGKSFRPEDGKAGEPRSAAPADSGIKDRVLERVSPAGSGMGENSETRDSGTGFSERTSRSSNKVTSTASGGDFKVGFFEEMDHVLSKPLNVKTHDFPRLLSKVLVDSARGEKGAVVVRLYPPSLGRMEIAFRYAGGAVSVRFFVETKEARDILIPQLSHIRELVRGSGIPLGTLVVAVGDDEGGGSFRRSWSGGRNSPKTARDNSKAEKNWVF